MADTVSRRQRRQHPAAGTQRSPQVNSRQNGRWNPGGSRQRSPGRRDETAEEAVRGTSGSRAHPPAGHDRRGPAGRRLASDRVPGPQRSSQRPPADQGTGPRRDHRARLPAERRGPDPGHPAHSHPWRDQLRHYPVRPGFHALRDRAGGAGQLLRLYRQHPDPGPPVRAGLGGAFRGAGRGGNHRDHRAGLGGGSADRLPERPPAGRGGLRDDPSGALGRGGQRRGGGAGHQVPAQPRPPDGPPPERAIFLARRRGPGGGLAGGAARGGGPRAGPDPWRLVRVVRVREGSRSRGTTA